MRLLPAAALVAALALPLSARAAESFDGCRYTITTLPATLTAQGVYCLQQDLGTNLAAGDAILVAANNVTIDCNDFKLGNLPAGESTMATGIRASARLNTTVRGCNIRGFRTGIALGGGGHLVERNRLESSYRYGIFVAGSPSTVRDNVVYDTGPGAGTTRVSGIAVLQGVDVIDNVVSIVVAGESDARAVGIDAETNGIAVIRGNRVRDIVSTSAELMSVGIFNGGGEADITDNYVSVPSGIGIGCVDGTGIMHGNRIAETGVPAALCDDSGGNLIR